MTEAPIRILVEQDMIPDRAFLLGEDGIPLKQFHITEADLDAELYGGFSRSQPLIKSFKRFFRENPKMVFTDLIEVNFTANELEDWRKALPDLTDEQLASWKRWGITPETASYFKEYGIHTGHSTYDVSGSGYIDLDYLSTVRTWIITGATVFSPRKWAPVAYRIYKATFNELRMARQLFSEDGHSLTDDELMDYIGYYFKDEGDSTKLPAVRVPAVLAISMKRNGVPPEYLKWAWSCGFRSYVEQVRLIDAYMNGWVTTEKLQSYHRWVEKGRVDELPDFIEMSKSGIPFEYLEIVL